MNGGKCTPREFKAPATLVAACAAAAMLLGAGCSNTATPGEAFDRVAAMTYSRDLRTGLCFSVFCWQDETRSVSYVPCTPDVLAQIIGPARGSTDGGGR